MIPTPRHRALLATLAALLCTFAALPFASATVARYLTLPALVEYSHVIVRARVGDAKTFTHAAWKKPMTDTTLEIKEVYLGDKKLRRAVVQQLGGEVNGITLKVPGDATLTKGAEVVVFLKRGEGGVYYLTALSQASYEVVRKQNKAWVRRDLSGLAFPSPVDPNTLQPGAEGPRELTSFEAELRALIASIKTPKATAPTVTPASTSPAKTGGAR